MNPQQARLDNRETVTSYERCAEDYAQSTRGDPPEAQTRLFGAFVERVGRGGRVLEIGSGPGWDADRLESEGIDVCRTDVTQAFLDVQAKRGKQVTRLDVIEDDIPGCYDGILCLYVLQHIGRSLIDGVVAKLAAALRPGGSLLVALREGAGETREIGDSSGVYHLTLWPQSEFVERLLGVGLRPEQIETFTGKDGEWLIVLARNT